MAHRFLEPPASVAIESEREVAVVVIGGGVAGLSAAISAAQHSDVVVITKSWLSDSNTDYAQGGVAAVLGRGDTFDRHVADTIQVGQGLCHDAVVRRVIEGGPDAIRRLVDWGGRFDLVTGGAFALGLEAGHSADRIVHAFGDGTGREIQRVLVEKARKLSRLTLLEHAFAVDLLVSKGRAAAVLVFSGGRFTLLRAGSVICATGGCGQLFRETTNPEVATGDGHALLFRTATIIWGGFFLNWRI